MHAKYLILGSNFDKEFYINLSKTKTFIEAYEMTEKKYYDFFGHYKYSSYNSYQTARKRRLENK